MDLMTVVLAATLGVAIYALHKIRKIHLACFRMEEALSTIRTETDHLFHQIQAYQELIALIRPVRPLPPLRGWAASPDFLLHVADHALSSRPQLIVECSSGASTVVLARCCQLNGGGRVLSLEHDPEYARKTRQRLDDHGLNDWAKVVDAPLVPYDGLDAGRWYSLAGLDTDGRQIDLLVIDGPPGGDAQHARYPAVPLLRQHFASNCTVFLDDAGRPEEVEIVARWLTEFPEFEKTALPAEKGCVALRLAENLR